MNLMTFLGAVLFTCFAIYMVESIWLIWHLVVLALDNRKNRKELIKQKLEEQKDMYENNLK